MMVHIHNVAHSLGLRVTNTDTKRIHTNWCRSYIQGAKHYLHPENMEHAETTLNHYTPFIGDRN